MTYRRLEIARFGGPEVLRVVEEDAMPEPVEDEVL